MKPVTTEDPPPRKFRSSSCQRVPQLKSASKAYEAGGDDYLIKPYQPDELKAKISVVIVPGAAPKELSGQVNDVMMRPGLGQYVWRSRRWCWIS